VPLRGDHYAVLGVRRDATPPEIRAAFRALARRYHPDANRTDPDAERHFKRAARAYEVVGDAAKRLAYDERWMRGRFGAPGSTGRASFEVADRTLYHSDLGHHSDFYQIGDPLTVAEAASLVGRDAGWLRRAIREGRLSATRGSGFYLVRRRDVERLDRVTPRRSQPAASGSRIDQSPLKAANDHAPAGLEPDRP
jgi:excisionase family DNA binding protein